MNKKLIYKRDFFKRLINNSGFKKGKNEFSRLLGRSIWHIVHTVDAELLDNKKDFCPIRVKTAHLKDECIRSFIKICNKTRRKKQIIEFKSPCDLYGVSFPILYGDELYGYIIICRLKTEPEEALLNMFHIFLEEVIEDVRKSMELSKLYETIRPRAIALSTIHTVNRLISSTLDLDELLPRIARLGLQIMRGKYCSIMFLDDEKKHLITKAGVNIGKKKYNKKNINVDKGIGKRLVKAMCPVLREKQLAVPMIDEDVIGVINVVDRISGQNFNKFDQEILITLAELSVIAIKNAKLHEEYQQAAIGSIKSLAMVLDTKLVNAYTHTNVFANTVVAIGEEMYLGADEIKNLYYAALLHDAGKIVIPDAILKKQTPLTGEEFEIVKEHPEKGAEIIKHLSILKPAIPIILHHHERYDGKGYPHGLKGEQIPIGARIMAVANAFEAMISERPYRSRKKTIDQAASEIKASEGKQFDPKVVAAFLRVIESGRIKDIFNMKEQVKEKWI